MIPGSDFEIPKNEIVDELRKKFDFKNNRIDCYTVCNENLFDALYDFSVGGLNTYYELFQQSSKFKELKDEVDNLKNKI